MQLILLVFVLGHRASSNKLEECLIPFKFLFSGMLEVHQKLTVYMNLMHVVEIGKPSCFMEFSSRLEGLPKAEHALLCND